MSNMWLVCCLSLVFLTTLCRAVPINRESDANVNVDRSNEKSGNESVCVSDDVLYKEGDPMPTSNECERCTCRPPKFLCEPIKCETKPGCRAVQRPGQCCPEYKCDCERNRKVYQNGERLEDTASPCKACYCQSGEIVCTLIECYRRDDCEPRYVNGTCCPKYDHCPPREPTPTPSSPSPQEQANPISADISDILDTESNGSDNNLQDNSVDSSKRIEILGEIMNDAPYSGINSLREYDEDSSVKIVSEESKDKEILEENMSEVHTERAEVKPEETTENEKLADSSETENTESPIQVQYNFELYATEVPKSGEPAESDDSTQTEMSQPLSYEEMSKQDEGMIGDGGPSWHPEPVKTDKAKTGEPFHSAEASSTENSQKDEADLNDSRDILATNEENITATMYTVPPEVDSDESKEDEESKEKNGKDNDSTNDIPVLNIKTDMSSENMSIVIPDEQQTSNENEESSEATSTERQSPVLVYEEGRLTVMGADSAVSLSFKREQETVTAKTILPSVFVSKEEITLMGDDTHSVKVGEGSSEEKDEDTKPGFSDSEERTTVQSINGKETLKFNSRIGSNEDWVVYEITGTTIFKESPSTTEDELRGEHTTAESNESVESSTTTEGSASDEGISTTSNALEGEHPVNFRSVPTGFHKVTEASDYTISTTPNVLEGEHPDQDRILSESETSTISTETTYDPSTTPNILEGEHPDNIKDESLESASTTEVSEIPSTTPNVLKGEHPENHESDFSESEKTTEIKETTENDEVVSTTTNILEGEHPKIGLRVAGESETTTESTELPGNSEDSSTTPNVLGGEHPGNNDDSSDGVQSTTETQESHTEDSWRHGETETTTIQTSTTFEGILLEDSTEGTSNDEPIVSGLASRIALSSEDVTVESETTAYTTTEGTAFEIIANSGEDNSAKILPPLIKINKTEITQSDKFEPLPENWLKGEDNLNSESNTESNLNTDSSAEKEETEKPSPESNEYIDFITTTENSEDSTKTIDDISGDSSSSTTVPPTSETEGTTIDDMSHDPEITTEDVYSWEVSGDKAEFKPFKRYDTHSFGTNAPMEVKPQYWDSIYTSGSKEIFNTDEIYGEIASYFGSSDGTHVMKVGNEASATEGSNEKTETPYSKEKESAETGSGSNKHTNKDMKESFSFEYIDSAAVETTTLAPNSTDSTTTERNQTETTTPRSAEVYSFYGDSNASESKSELSAQDSEANTDEKHETSQAKDDNYNFWSNLRFADY